MHVGMRRSRAWTIVGSLVLAVAAGHAPGGMQSPVQPASEGHRAWGPWLEHGAPFVSSVLDARAAGEPFPTDNLTPRALVLPLGHDMWAAFDVDLLRIAAIWQGAGVTEKALAPGSYHAPDRKTPGGQSALPEPDGRVWLASGIYPGWQAGDRPLLTDPREPAPSPEEVGRGPLPASFGRFDAVRATRDGVVLEYTVGAARIRERLKAVSDAEGRAVLRHLEVGPSEDTLWLLLGHKERGLGLGLGADDIVSLGLAHPDDPRDRSDDSPHVVRVAPRSSVVHVVVVLDDGPIEVPLEPAPISLESLAARWPAEVTTPITPAPNTAAYVVDDIALPLDNPWRRNVRAGDIQFLSDGTGVVVTLDGDVWLVRGLTAGSREARWRRFASGLHEPLTLAIRDDEVFVFDRNGIWRLRDTNANGEADVHELFSNAFAQTADMREFPNTIRLAPGGAFVIAKGGQEATTLGKHNGSVLRVAPDGRSATVLGYGLRQPNIGVDLRTGLVTASDQQGHYIPTTPLHIVRDRQFYGFMSTSLPPETYPSTPVADPLTWIPHSVNASGMSQVWLHGARMGPLTDRLVHIGFNAPELFQVLIDERSATPQAAVVSVTRAFDFPPLNGAVNPADGQLYLAGFQILGWGTTATRLAGLGRVRYTGAPSPLPREVAVMDRGVLLRFDVELDPVLAAEATRFELATWGYQRSHRYGSPQLKADGTPGSDRLQPVAAVLSTDRRSVLVVVPDLAPVMQLEVAWSLASADGLPIEGKAYATPYMLTPFVPEREGFVPMAWDRLTSVPVPDPEPTTPAARASVAEGRRVYETFGCMACHATAPGAPDRLGPSFVGLYGSSRTFADGSPPVVADEVYLREAIVEPAATVVAGYDTGEVGMPSYAGVLTDAEVASVILFIKSLR
jgi:mono/diheme cytochrome c family protein